MSLIVLHGRYMLCDSITVSGGLLVVPHSGHRKIVRCPDGSLFGAIGGRFDGDALRAWAKAGMDFDKPPKLHPDKDYDGEYRWALMRPDCRKFFGNLYMQMHEVGDACLGEETASDVVWGAIDMAMHTMLGRVPIPTILACAMEVAVKRCLYIAAPIRIFDLDHPELDP